MRSDLAHSYGQDRLPRYTSYPTAPHFSPAIGEENYRSWLKSVPVRAAGLDLPARPVLPIHVLVLRMPHVGDEARRSDRDLCSRPAYRSAPCRRDHRPENAGLSCSLRRRYADDHVARNVRGSRRRATLFVFRASRCRNRRRDRSAHADGADDRGARLLRRQPRESGRPEF